MCTTLGVRFCFLVFCLFVWVLVGECWCEIFGEEEEGWSIG